MTANCGQVAALNFIAAGFLCYVVFGFWLELVLVGWHHPHLSASLCVISIIRSHTEANVCLGAVPTFQTTVAARHLAPRVGPAYHPEISSRGTGNPP